MYYMNTIKQGVFVDEDHSKLPTLYWLHSFINGPISGVLLLIIVHLHLLSCLFFYPFCLTAIKTHVIKYFTTVNERNCKKYFCLLNNQVEFLKN